MRKLARERTSEGLQSTATARKRQKQEHETKADIGDPSSQTAPKMQYDSNKNSKLKGRRRFKADLDDVKGFCQEGYVVEGLTLKRVTSDDDEEGSFQVAIVDKAQKRILSATFMVSDASEYPQSHSYFCHSDDAELPPGLQSLLERTVDQRPREIKDLLDWFCACLAKIIAPETIDVDAETDQEESDDGSVIYDYDDDMNFDEIAIEPNTILHLLQRDFVEVVASSYKPGIIRISGGNDFILSVSIPVITLAETIPPRALMAWDRRLLSRSQHLTLLIAGFRGLYPVLESGGTYTKAATQLVVSLSFKVGLSERYKPGKEQVQEAVRKHRLVAKDAEDDPPIREKVQGSPPMFWDDDDDDQGDTPAASGGVEEEVEDDGRFDRFSLSGSLESLIESSFLHLVQLRRQFGLGWAGAEVLLSEVETRQSSPEEVYAASEKSILAADEEENGLARSNPLVPYDPLHGQGKDQPINLPLTAFSYLIRRLSLCTKYCIVCHNKLDIDLEALKPYVCGNKLCSFQYYALNRGPSLEYEIIHNPQTVDLLVSLAYVAAVEGTMDDPLPVGLDLRVPYPGHLGPSYLSPSHQRARLAVPVTGFASVPSPHTAAQHEDQQQSHADTAPGTMVEFDTLSKQEMRAAIANLIDTLPPINEMKKHITRRVTTGKSLSKLHELFAEVLPAAWLILRWIIGSCTAYIEEITSGDECIKNLDPNWRQFRLTVGAPDAEAKFKAAVRASTAQNPNAAKYPALYAFHGSPLRNWHSIVRHGLWYKEIAHGRAYGNGVYLAKDAVTSMGSYATPGTTVWCRSQTSPTNCVALAEVVNLPNQFVSHNPFFVIGETSWIMCRYLLLKGVVTSEPLKEPDSEIPYVQLDPAHKTVMQSKEIQIPDPMFQLESILKVRRSETFEEDPDEADVEVFSATEPRWSQSQSRHNAGDHDMDLDDDDDYKVRAKSRPKAPAMPPKRPLDDWQHDSAYVQGAVDKLMLPPFESTSSASNAIQRELRDMIKEQENASSLRELGWYMPEGFIGNNLYQWIVELHSFHPELPIAKDMKTRSVNSVIFEIRFPPQFPVSPPFFRILTPRFLPFIHGGGGHVTGGGSICMDLLTADGWLPSYNIPAILMQIKLAISNLDPRPARLASNWDQPYAVREALEGYKRAAATHHWKIPDGLDRLVS